MRKNTDGFRLSKDFLLPGILFALVVRWCVAAYPYSGYKSPPMYGDFEAQRHWQEITLHTPLTKWYINTTHNDLEYWGLDYPPLTAYHMLFIAYIAEWLDPESVRLFASRGYENENHKEFMRWTVFFSDLYIYVPAAFCLCIEADRVKVKGDKNVFKRVDIATTILLLYPGLILIDHGHFQYNCVSLGLFLVAIFCILAIESDVLASIFFMMAINYKQMELYHSLPFFFYLLRKCFITVGPKIRIFSVIGNFNKLAVVVICSFGMIYYPFLSSWDTVSHVIYRMFPLKRGVFEDKVSNVWCFINVFIKLKSIYTNEMMAKLCLFTTTLAAMPSCLDLFVRINKKKFILSLINVSLAFFLFSFQVHEKTILLVAIPVALHFSEDPFMCFWFLLVSNFSMLPLLMKDGLLLPFIATTLIYISVYSIALKMANNTSGLFTFINANKVYKTIQKDKSKDSMFLKIVSHYFFFSLVGMVFLTICLIYVKPPLMFPDLYPLLISVYSCSHFLLFFLYFNYQQLILPKCVPFPHKVKQK
ncbi:PREDICTED: dolichyl pyrophosphate Man9GlcNAc2 alpha-1,3-glucosyltransferase [Papilio xuthus]|uniref:Alpha-1,3-glucosyltransferase n=1 Tax=Papilio xuthus TaxID=66420 RepID=A0AAJ6Z919_PAPXU|nr:PREDICTED: dolichyl pyrophosphate Man9GlcNAc2 alpha-1,3-glucosyltransferase [Papilio xuthus]